MIQYRDIKCTIEMNYFNRNTRHCVNVVQRSCTHWAVSFPPEVKTQLAWKLWSSTLDLRQTELSFMTSWSLWLSHDLMLLNFEEERF